MISRNFDEHIKYILLTTSLVHFPFCFTHSSFHFGLSATGLCFLYYFHLPNVRLHGRAVSVLASHRGDPVSIPGRVREFSMAWLDSSHSGTGCLWRSLTVSSYLQPTYNIKHFLPLQIRAVLPLTHAAHLRRRCVLHGLHQAWIATRNYYLYFSSCCNPLLA